jgi:hypothetical protein
MLVPGETASYGCGLSAGAVSLTSARAKVKGMGPYPITIALEDAANVSSSIRPASDTRTLACGGRVATDRAASSTRVEAASSPAALSSVCATANIDTCMAEGSTRIVAGADAAAAID